MSHISLCLELDNILVLMAVHSNFIKIHIILSKAIAFSLPITRILVLNNSIKSQCNASYTGFTLKLLHEYHAVNKEQYLISWYITNT